MTYDMNYGNTRVKGAYQSLRDQMNDELTGCTGEQQALFYRMYPQGVPDDKIAWALTQINNTRLKNNERARLHPGAPDDSCSCHISPPCSFCESSQNAEVTS
jgi:hypothetical protein